MNIIHTDNTEQVIQDIVTALSDTSRPTLLLVSGGSAADVFVQAWQRLDAAYQEIITVSLADERFGVEGHADSNWRLICSLGFAPRVTDIPVLTADGADMQSCAAAWGSQLAACLDQGYRVVAILGIGTDSHTAGIKPNSEATRASHELVCAYSYEDYDRITITPKFLDRVDTALVYTEGEAKAEAITLLEQDQDPIIYPSQFIKQCAEATVYYVRA